MTCSSPDMNPLERAEQEFWREYTGPDIVHDAAAKFRSRADQLNGDPNMLPDGLEVKYHEEAVRCIEYHSDMVFGISIGSTRVEYIRTFRGIVLKSKSEDNHLFRPLGEVLCA